MPKPRRKTRNLVVEFDDKARREHLTGFSARKRARRIHGLAQQKRKEHQAIRQHRAEKRQAAKEADEEENAEKTSAVFDSKPDEKVEECVVYQDAQTQNRWGGEVTVVATSEIPSEVEPTREKKEKAGEDTAQEYACSLERFVNEVKGKLPGKKSKKNKNQKAAVSKKGGDAKSIAKRILKSRKKKR